MPIRKLFATPIYQNRLESRISNRLNNEILRDCHIIRKMDPYGRQWSKENYFNGYTSYSSISDLHLRFAPFMELKVILDREIRKFAKSIGFNLDGGKLKMSTCWINTMGKGTHHSLHLHPLCTISGTYYVSVPKDSGVLKFEDPRMGLFMAAPPKKSLKRQSNSPFASVVPREGEVLLWESWLRHEVTANRAKSPRISVSFNYEWY